MRAHTTIYIYTKVMVFEGGESTTECDILIEGEKVEQVKEFVYFGSLFTNDGEHDTGIERRVNAENKIPILTCGSENWVWQKKNGSRISAVEMRSLRSLCGVSRKDRCRNSDVRQRSGLKEDVARAERDMLRWFGHLESCDTRRLFCSVNNTRRAEAPSIDSARRRRGSPGGGRAPADVPVDATAEPEGTRRGPGPWRGGGALRPGPALVHHRRPSKESRRAVCLLVIFLKFCNAVVEGVAA
ncbi:hypothetical protein EVAR_104012_1 [Eumeta japonica]|uniref:Uncharacterized protein n=1 Tax=Eumeta variegata TaxID=151549 RepID=A0A4C1XZR1_EUMVA|nr:hypothetical protein EVAR_104012_1 [Eumeta japonica]